MRQNKNDEAYEDEPLVIVEEDEGDVVEYEDDDNESAGKPPKRSDNAKKAPYRDRRPEDDESLLIEDTAIRAQDRARESFFQSWRTEHKSAVDSLDSVQTRIALAEKEIRQAFENQDYETYETYRNISQDLKAEEKQLTEQIQYSQQRYAEETRKLPFESERELIDKKANLFYKNFKNEFGRDITQSEAAYLSRIEEDLIAKDPVKNDPRRTAHWDNLLNYARQNFGQNTQNTKRESTMEDTKRRGGPAIGMGGRGDNQSKPASEKKEFVLTRHHKNALESMGIYDAKSPEAKRYIKAWAKYDPEEAKNRFWDVGG